MSGFSLRAPGRPGRRLLRATLLAATVMPIAGPGLADVINGNDDNDYIIALPEPSTVNGLEAADVLWGDPAKSVDKTDIQRASASGLGGTQVQGNGFSRSVVLSPDGTKVAFTTSSNNLGADTLGSTNLYLRDLTTGQVTLIDRTESGTFAANGEASDPSFSPDGRLIVYSTVAGDVIGGDGNFQEDVFVYDIATGINTLISADASGVNGNGPSFQPSFSPDSKRVVFASSASNLVPGDTVGTTDLFVKTLGTGSAGAIERVTPADANGYSENPRFAPDAERILFYSNASNLTDVPDGEDIEDIFVLDLATDVIRKVNTDASGNRLEYWREATISPDGTKVYFTELTRSDDTPYQIIEKVVDTGAISVVSVDRDGDLLNRPTTSPSASSELGSPALSGNGRLLAFYTASDVDDVGSDTNNVADIYIKDLLTGALTRISTGTGGEVADNGSDSPSFAADASRIAFLSSANNLVTPDGNSFNQEAYVATFNLAAGAADTINGGEGGDRIYGMAGGDRLIGGTGDDSINGGRGTDTAVYAGTRRQYTVTRSTTDATRYTVTDNRSGSPEGTDDLVSVEQISFGTNLFALSAFPWPNTPPTATSPVAIGTDEGKAVSGSVTATDKDGDTVIFTTTRAPSKGSVIVQSDGDFTYTPEAGESGADSFDVGVSDGQGGTGTIRVNVTIAVTTSLSVSAIKSITETTGSGTTRKTRLATVTTRQNGTALSSLTASDNRFVIESGGLFIRAGQTVDRESGATIPITVTFNADNKVLRRSIAIPVIDVDEFNVSAPTDADSKANLVNGLAPAGTAVGITARGRDRDATRNTVSYTLLDATSEFSIGSGSGILRVKGTIDPDKGTRRTLRVRATSTDGSTAVTSFTLSIDPKGVTRTGDGKANSLSGSGWNDTLSGLGGNDTLRSGRGADNLRGGDGDDLLDGGVGRDRMDGGDGSDTADYSNRSSAVVMTVASGALGVTAVDEDTLISIENVLGGSAGDTLNGDSGPNRLFGNGGRDTLNGNGGDDWLDGGSSNDTLNGGSGGDRLIGRSGNDRLNGGPGLDTADYSTAANAISLVISKGTVTNRKSGVTTEGTDTIVVTTSGARKLSTVENIIGSRFADRLDGRGVDAIRLEGGPGDDLLIGDGRNAPWKQRASYRTAANAMLIDLAKGFSDNLKAGVNTEGRDTLTGMGMVFGSRFADRIIGDGSVNVFNGSGGADVMTGGGRGDEFHYLDRSDSPPSAPDEITDFSVAGGDWLDLSFVGANSWIGTKAFTASSARQVRWRKSGKNVIVEVDLDSDVAPEMAIVLRGRSTFERKALQLVGDPER